MPSRRSCGTGWPRCRARWHHCGRRDGTEVLPALGQDPDHSVAATARQLALVLVGAAAPFAPTSYSRARLIRQMHASGLLTDEHLRHARRVLEVEGG